MEVAFMVCAINPSLDLHTDSTELLQLQQVGLHTDKMIIYYTVVKSKVISPDHHVVYLIKYYIL